MKIVANFGLLVGFLVLPQTSWGERSGEFPVSITWSLTEPVKPGAGVLDLETDKFLSLGKVSPNHAFHLAEDVEVENGKVFLPRDTELAWANPGRTIACEPMRSKGKNNFRCLQDSDGDGTLDFALMVIAHNFNIYQGGEDFQYMMGNFTAIEFMGSEVLKKPIPIASLKDEPSRLQADFYLKGKAGGKRVSVAICAKRPTYGDVCSGYLPINLTEGKGESYLFGSRITANLKPNGSAVLSVTSVSPTIDL